MGAQAEALALFSGCLVGCAKLQTSRTMFRIMTSASLLTCTLGNKYSVLVFGDSWGSEGPKFTTLQETFDKHSTPAVVRSRSVGGRGACQWYNDCWSGKGNALVKAAQDKFPELENGPDFVWYTAGGNDLMLSSWEYKSCMGFASSEEKAQECFKKEINKINECTDKMLEAYWDKFPKSKVFQAAYDIPCAEGLKCQAIAKIRNPYCSASDTTCHNSFQVFWQETEIGGRQRKYLQPRYTGLNILGAVQKAAGIPGADVGKPVLDQGGPCKWMDKCVHPRPGSPAAEAVGEAFWDLFFSKHLNGTLNPDSDALVDAAVLRHPSFLSLLFLLILPGLY